MQHQREGGLIESEAEESDDLDEEDDDESASTDEEDPDDREEENDSEVDSFINDDEIPPELAGDIDDEPDHMSDNPPAKKIRRH